MKGLYLVGLFNWYEVFTGRHTDFPYDTLGARILWWPPILLFLFFDTWFFRRPGVSVALETQFDGFSRRKRYFLAGLAIIWLAGLIPFVVISKNALVATFHLPSPP
jgi:hypothetical protein